MAKYKHNDYYGYINKVQEKAISNPEWFWGDSSEAKEAREWLYKNGATEVVNEIYDYTPDDLKKKISYKKLSTKKASEKYNKGITDATNESAKYVGGALAASAALPFVIEAGTTFVPSAVSSAVSNIAAHPVATISKGAADLVGGIAGGEVVRGLSNTTSEVLTGNSLDYNIGNALRKIFSPTEKNAKVAENEEGKKKAENLGAWFNPFTYLGGAAGSQIAKKGLVEAADKAIINKALKTGKLKIEGPTQYRGVHHSNTPIYEPDYACKRWDVINHNADPSGIFFNQNTPVESGFLSKRKYKSNWTIDSNSSLIQQGEIKGFEGGTNSIRNKIVKLARKKGADTVVFNDIADNTLEHQNIIFATEKAKLNLDSHNYYDKFRKISDEVTSKLSVGDDKALKSLANKIKGKDSLKRWVRKAVNEDGSVNVEHFDRINDELYQMFEAAGIPYNRADQIVNKRVFDGAKVAKSGTLRDHALSVAKSGEINPLVYDPTGTLTKKDVVLGDLFHDHGIMITKDQILGQQYHELFGKRLGSILGLDRKTLNAIGSHMGTTAKTPIAKAIQSHDKLAGASIDFAKQAWKDGKKRIFSGRSLDPKLFNYGTEPIKHFNAENIKEIIPLIEKAITKTSDGLNSMRSGLVKNSAFEGYVQSEDFASKNLLKVLDKLKTDNPTIYKEVIGDIKSKISDSTSKSKGIMDLVKKAYAKAKLKKDGPIIGGKLYQNGDDFANAAWWDLFGFDPNPKYRWGSDEEATLGFKKYIESLDPNKVESSILFASEKPSGGQIYSIKRKTANSKGSSYVGNLTANRYPLILDKKIIEQAQKNVVDYLKAYENYQKAIGKGTVDKEAINTLIKLQPMMEDPMYLAQVFNASVKGTGPAINIAEDKSIRDAVESLSKYYSNKVLGVNQDSFAVNGRQLIPYYVPKSTEVFELPSMPDFGINYWNNPKAIQYITAKLQEMYPGKFPKTIEWLTKSPRVSTDGLYAAMRKDVPNLVVKGPVNDFSGYMVGGQYPIEYIASANSKLVNGIATDPIEAGLYEVRDLVAKYKDVMVNSLKDVSDKIPQIPLDPTGHIVSNVTNNKNKNLDH